MSARTRFTAPDARPRRAGHRALPTPGTFPLLTLDAASGARYRLEHRGDLAPTNWTLLAPVTLEDNQFYYVDEPVTNHWRRFYRAVPQ